MKKYRPIQGDTWESVSYKLYGSSDYAYDMIKANPNMRLTEYFDGSETLYYPKISSSSASTSNLPPWREA